MKTQLIFWAHQIGYSPWSHIGIDWHCCHMSMLFLPWDPWCSSSYTAGMKWSPYLSSVHCRGTMSMRPLTMPRCGAPITSESWRCTA